MDEVGRNAGMLPPHVPAPDVIHAYRQRLQTSAAAALAQRDLTGYIKVNKKQQAEREYIETLSDVLGLFVGSKLYEFDVRQRRDITSAQLSLWQKIDCLTLEPIHDRLGDEDQVEELKGVLQQLRERELFIGYRLLDDLSPETRLFRQALMQKHEKKPRLDAPPHPAAPTRAAAALCYFHARFGLPVDGSAWALGAWSTHQAQVDPEARYGAYMEILRAGQAAPSTTSPTRAAVDRSAPVTFRADLRKEIESEPVR